MVGIPSDNSNISMLNDNESMMLTQVKQRVIHQQHQSMYGSIRSQSANVPGIPSPELTSGSESITTSETTQQQTSPIITNSYSQYLSPLTEVIDVSIVVSCIIN